ncbi:uracil-xanthine permease family protein [Chroogloeocystis siderophila]|jgi:xanthine permease XanP|uniref:Xanthine permease XanP n=1 Tax=Chroogloeocystis siderophila 5.2 s.c.1 TaxID=247279 RepID=A0A1U7HXG3_9CHRO|nr:nucleobase:cation symporter-2 family protein [Chroogloeocystis siderophila]OKH28321.1 xanthine permease XanP [Chroogloeocystis siderophila 5.2 s.c.1]
MTNIKITSEERVDVKPASGLIYGLNDRPPFVEAALAAAQHVLAIFVGIITPPLLISNALQLSPVDTAYIVSMSLFISGVATFIQAKKIGPIGSGLLSIQGTSFSFLGPIIAAGTAVIEAGGTPESALSLIFGLCFFGSFIEIFLSRFLHLVRKIITPLVTGTIVSIIGLTLIKTAIISIGGGVVAQRNNTFGSPQSLGVAALVLITIIVLNISKNPILRMSSVVIGLIIGYVVASFLGMVNFSGLQGLPVIAAPIPFRYGLSFNFAAFIPFILLYLITTIESIGDLTATSAVSGEPIKGSVYIRRIKGGVLGDGINSLIAAVFNTFPNTTFSQNNGVIQITGVGSRYIGYFIAVILALLGLFPIVGGIFRSLPQSVLGGATLIMFGSIVVAGINILSSVQLDRRALIVVGTSLAIGLGVTYVPEILDATPTLVKSLFSSGISAGGLTAIVLNWILPQELSESSLEEDEMSSEDLASEA